jgi:hypothetical protein
MKATLPFTFRRLFVLPVLLFVCNFSNAQSKEETIEFITHIDDEYAWGYSSGKLIGTELKMYNKKGEVESIGDIRKSEFVYKTDYGNYRVYDAKLGDPLYSLSNVANWLFETKSEAVSLINALNHLKIYAKPLGF